MFSLRMGFVMTLFLLFSLMLNLAFIGQTLNKKKPYVTGVAGMVASLVAIIVFGSDVTENIALGVSLFLLTVSAILFCFGTIKNDRKLIGVGVGLILVFFFAIAFFVFSS